MAETTLDHLLLKYARNLNEEFEKASWTGKGTSSEIAEFRENAFRHLLARLFPPPYQVVKGQISDVDGASSQSIDAIIVNPAHPHTIDAQGKFELIFADGVDCAIEVKPDLTRKQELRRGVQQLQSVKQRKRSKSPLLLKPLLDQETLDHSVRIPTLLFSMRAPADIGVLVRNLRAVHSALNVQLDEQFDFVIVHQVGILCNYKLAKQNPFAPPAGTPSAGLFFEAWRDQTLAGMILHVSTSVPAIARLSDPILFRYLKHLKPAEITRFAEQ